MNFEVILLKQDDHAYVARPVLWPNSTVQGKTEQEALERVRELIRDLSAKTQVVQVEVDIPQPQANNPWLAKSGIFADDPTWDDFLKEMADYRRQLDDEEIPDLA